MAQHSTRLLNLKTLNTKVTNSIIYGVLIRTQDVRVFTGKKKQGERAVWNFTLRDSITDYINATYWGSVEYVRKLNQQFCVGDVVSVSYSKIIIRRVDDPGEQYRPAVTSPYALTLNEGQSSIQIYDGDDYHKFSRLINYPTKPADSHLTLADIYNSGGTLRGDYIDLLAAVRSVSAVKILKAKSDGRELRKRDVILVDQTSEGLRITLWDIEFIKRADQWTPRETVLFITDMRVDWSSFEGRMTAVLTSRSIITEDPVVEQAEVLRKYARNALFAPTAIINEMLSQLPDPRSIRTVMTVQRIIQIIFTPKMQNDFLRNQSHFTALIYGFITAYDIDGCSSIISTRCARCYNKIMPLMNNCMNMDCPVGSGVELTLPTTQFDMMVHVSDHTGTLKCRLTGKIAENIIGKTVSEFQELNDEKKEELKWKYLLERCAVRIIVIKRETGRPIVSIVHWELADMKEVSNHLPVY